MPCPHTAEMLCEVMTDTYLEWNIERKLSTLTCDNATTNDAMISLLLDKFNSTSHMWHPSLFHVRCAAHILNLIVRDGLDMIKGSIEKIRDSVAFWTNTPKRREKFADAVHHLSINHGKKLSLDCVTRWNSTFLMLETAIAYKDVFDRLKLRDKAFKCCPDSSDWELATEICKRLEIFYKVTELFSGTKYPTSNLFFANVCTIKLELDKWTYCGIEVIEKMAIPMQQKYDKYWENIHGILGIAAVLDPRYKMDLIEYYFKKIYGSNAPWNVDSIRTLCYDLLTVYEGKAKDKSSSSKEPSMPSTLEEDDALSDFDSYVPDNKKGKSAHVKSELDNYLEDERLPRKGEFDILVWWKANRLKYPTLQAIARDVLAVPVSSVASESSFSTSGRILRPNRSRLHPKTLEALMCTQNWLIAKDNGGNYLLLFLSCHVSFFHCYHV